jgi:hypothetical protein
MFFLVVSFTWFLSVEWLVDSVTSQYMAQEASLFSSLSNVHDHDHKIYIGDSSALSIVGFDNITV